MAAGRSSPPTPLKLRSSETTSWITRRTRFSAPRPRGQSASSLPITCKANAILTPGRRLKPWCASGWLPLTLLRPLLQPFPPPRVHSISPYILEVERYRFGSRILSLRKLNIIDKPRRAHECRHRDQHAVGEVLHRIQAFRIYDFEVVEPDRSFPGNFLPPSSHQFFRVAFPGFPQFLHSRERPMQHQRLPSLRRVEISVS